MASEQSVIPNSIEEARKRITELHALMHKHSEFGAEGEDARSMAFEILQLSSEQEGRTMPISPLVWGLHPHMPGSTKVAQELSDAAEAACDAVRKAAVEYEALLQQIDKVY